MKQIRKIVVCPECKGTGLEYQRNSNGSVAVSHGQPLTQTCSVCEGERCVLMQITTEYFRLTPQILDEEKKKSGGLFSWLKR